jgi:hypothetical protein
MRELTKSMFGCTWAMSVFGLQQLMDLAKGAGVSADGVGKVAQRFDNVTAAAIGEVEKTMLAAFDTGNNLQHGMVNFLFSSLSSLTRQLCSRRPGSAPCRAPDDGPRPEGRAASSPRGEPDGGAGWNPFARSRFAGAGPAGNAGAPRRDGCSKSSTYEDAQR